MRAANPVTIVGGGLAGLTLGIGLRRRGTPVTIWEASGYPRHRVCGEFISGEGQRSMERLGISELLPALPISRAKDAAFFSGRVSAPVRVLPEPALCISRYFLDHALAREFQRLGGDLRSRKRFPAGAGAGVVRANGRRPIAITDGWRWFGLKVHARGVEASAGLEMHLTPSGYVGLCSLAGGEVNVCGLFRSRKAIPDLARSWRDWLRGPADSVLYGRLAGAEFDEGSFCSVAALALRRPNAPEPDECAIGDALTMIPPVTGNGMSMAFESAELAIEPLEEFSRGRISWREAQGAVAAACAARFSRRLAWADVLQRALFTPLLRRALFQLGARSNRVWRLLFERTR